MLRSKALKEDVEEKETIWYKIYMSDWFNYIYKPYNKVRYFFERLNKNYLFYKNVLRFDYDFDSHGYLLMLHYKLSELYKCIENGHAIQEDKDMKALRIAIKLSKRLWDDNYDERTWRKIETKYGKLQTWSTPLPDRPGYYQYNSKFGDGPWIKERQLMISEERLELLTIAEKCLKRDERNLYAIMLKYRRTWWS